jgi:rhodanese-related sulfurtransferase
MFTKLFGLPTISVETVAVRLGQCDFFVFDINPDRVWVDGHVPGACNLDPGDYTESDLPQNKDATLVFYCAGPMCPAAPGAAWRAKRMGYQNVFVMSAGISGWLEQNLPVEQSGTVHPRSA